MKVMILLLTCVVTLGAQTTVNGGRTFKGALDATEATQTKVLRTVSSDRSGPCTAPNEVVLNSANGKLFACIGSTWMQLAGGGGGSGYPDPGTTIFLSEEFASGSTPSGGPNGYALGWTASTSAMVNVASAAGRHGLVQMTTGTGTSLAHIFTRANAGFGVFHPSDSFEVIWVFKVDQNDSNTKCRFGLSSNPDNNAAANGIYIEKLPADTSWFGVTRASSTETRTVSVAAVNTNYLVGRIRRLSGTVIGFTIATTIAGLGSAAEQTSTTNIPTSGLQLFFHMDNNSSGVAKTATLDYAHVLITGLSR